MSCTPLRTASSRLGSFLALLLLLPPFALVRLLINALRGPQKPRQGRSTPCPTQTDWEPEYDDSLPPFRAFQDFDPAQDAWVSWLDDPFVMEHNRHHLSRCLKRNPARHDHP